MPATGRFCQLPPVAVVPPQTWSFATVPWQDRLYFLVVSAVLKGIVMTPLCGVCCLPTSLARMFDGCDAPLCDSLTDTHPSATTAHVDLPIVELVFLCALTAGTNPVQSVSVYSAEGDCLLKTRCIVTVFTADFGVYCTGCRSRHGSCAKRACFASKGCSTRLQDCVLCSLARRTYICRQGFKADNCKLPPSTGR